MFLTAQAISPGGVFIEQARQRHTTGYDEIASVKFATIFLPRLLLLWKQNLSTANPGGVRTLGELTAAA